MPLFIAFIEPKPVTPQIKDDKDEINSYDFSDRDKLRERD